jgi:hypothetical protein
LEELSKRISRLKKKKIPIKFMMLLLFQVLLELMIRVKIKSIILNSIKKQ